LLAGAAAFSAAGFVEGALPLADMDLADVDLAAAALLVAALFATVPEVFSVDALALLADAFWLPLSPVRAFVVFAADFTVAPGTGFPDDCSEDFRTAFVALALVSTKALDFCSFGFSFSMLAAFVTLSPFLAISILRIGAVECST
jgi:hypothetical protein